MDLDSWCIKNDLTVIVEVLKKQKFQCSLDLRELKLEEMEELIDLLKGYSLGIRARFRRCVKQLHDCVEKEIKVASDPVTIPKQDSKTINLIQASEIIPKPDEQEQINKCKLGEGGFGIVYKAKWNGMDVAMKTVHFEKLTEKAQVELLKEAEFYKNLHHPNVIQLVGICRYKGNISLLLPLADCSLHQMLSDERKYPTISWSTRLQFAQNIAKGMLYLHRTTPPIIHRDLKSLNVLIRKGVALITDFGLARVKSESRSLTGIVGTPSWMAPEVLTGIHIQLSADVYSFGMVLYELVTRKIPFQGLRTTEIIKEVVEYDNRPKVKETEKANAPVGFIPLMERCWQRDAKKRPNFKEIVNTLEEMKPIKVPQVVENPISKCPVDFGPKMVSFSNLEPKPTEREKIANGKLLLRSGSLGTAYRAKWGHVDVVVKSIESTRLSEEAKSGLVKEAKHFFKLNHPNVNPLLGICFESHICFILPWAQYSLYDILSDELQYAIDWSTRLKYAIQVANGMNCLHQASPQIVHRDLTSKNILVHDHVARVADYGLGCVKSEGRRDSGGIGSPAWMAPELLTESKIQAKVDVWSFAMILYELLTRKIPFQGLTIVEVITAVVSLNKRPKVTEAQKAEAPNGFIELMEKCWELDPKKRPDFTEIIETLQEVELTFHLSKLRADCGTHLVSIGEISPHPKEIEKMVESKSILYYRSSGIAYRTIWKGIDVVVKVTYISHCTALTKLEMIKEAKLLFTVLHENVNQLLAISYEDDYFCLILHWAQDSLYDLLYKLDLPTLDWSTRMQYAIQIANGMNYLHQASPPILHRDLRSRNILIHKNVAMVTDFGLSRIKTESLRGSSEEYSSLAWMAPEMFDRAIDSRTVAVDVWSFAMIMYELLTRRTPFQGLDAPKISEAIAQLQQRPTWTEAEKIGAPPGFIELMETCWQTDAKSRPDFKEILVALKKIAVTANPFSNPMDDILPYVVSSKDLEPQPQEEAKIAELKLSLGDGSLGRVYRGKWKFQDVVIKCLRFDQLSELAKLELLKEAKVLFHTKHAHVNPLLGICFQGFYVCFIMQWAPTSLCQVLLEDCWSTRLHYAIQIAQGLNYLHQASPPIIHYNLKSCNVLIRNKVAILTDCGFFHVKSETIRDSGDLQTPAWMSPERLLDGKVDQTTDVWSFAMVMYELLTGKTPFQGLCSVNIIKKVVNEDQRPSVTRIEKARAPAGFIELMEMCWQRDPEKRPQVKDIINTLQRIAFSLASECAHEPTEEKEK